MHRYLLLCIVLMLFTACDQSAPPPAENKAVVTMDELVEKLSVANESERINEWFELKFEEELAFSPIWQSVLGRKTDYGKIDDFSREAELVQLEWRRDSVAEMKSGFDRNQLSDEAKTSYDIWEYQLQEAEAAHKFIDNDYIFHQMQGAHAFLPQVLIAFHPVDELSDMEAYISRIEEAGRAVEQLIVRSKLNADKGVRPPRFAFEYVIEEAGKLISGAPFEEGEKENDIWANATGKIEALLESGKITMNQAEVLSQAARKALLDYWQPAYANLVKWQKEDIPNSAEQSSGVGSLPNGTDFYNERLSNWTTTALSADEIHEIGLAEVSRLRGEMEAIKDKVGFEGELADFFVHLRESKDDERFYYPDTDEGRLGYIADASAAIERIKSELPNYFGLLPKADLEVKRVEAFREQDGAAQHYYPGTPDGSRPGIYYAHLSDMKALPKRELEVIAYHEGLPGHHMQIAIAQELEGVPTFRTQAGFGAYSEGWGLYSEFLAKEIPGSYADPYSDFGRLGSEIWRAIRLVVDTGLHSKGWSEEKAVQYFMSNAAAPETQVRSEIRRYLVLPGQATSYKIGMLKILELRAKARSELGENFDIRGFHDTVLGGGALPLVILERRVRDWIASIKPA
ncbi:MAG: DUF885 family protein [Gammaproteobacteria bacterium]|nr:DUF885 family protein [Gammaproteobacteria bacterium]